VQLDPTVDHAAFKAARQVAKAHGKIVIGTAQQEARTRRRALSS
jgi:hypothetical protein